MSRPYARPSRAKRRMAFGLADRLEGQRRADAMEWLRDPNRRDDEIDGFIDRMLARLWTPRPVVLPTRPPPAGAGRSTVAELTYLSLFSGIGGLDLGLDRAGWRCVGQVERDPYCRRVLARHWPEVPRHDDVRTAVAWWRSGATRPAVRLVAGGFPCQPFSTAGGGLGMGDERWGWPWMFDVVRELRPRYVLVENVAALLSDADAFGRVLGDLASLGFDAEWSVLSACAVGAPHVRERLFLVAYPDGLDGPQRVGARFGETAVPGGDLPAGPWPDPEQRPVEIATRGLRVADGAPAGLDAARVRATGNAVVPQVAEHIGRMIAAADREATNA